MTENKKLNPYNWKSQFWSICEGQNILNMGASAFALDISRLSPREFRFFLLGAAFDFGTNSFPQVAEELLAIVEAIFGQEPAEEIRGYIQEFEDSGCRASTRSSRAKIIYDNYSTVKFIFL